MRANTISFTVFPEIVTSIGNSFINTMKNINHTRSSISDDIRNIILALLQRIFLMSSLMLLLVWLIFFMVLIKLLPILGTISGKTVKLMVLALICLGNNRQD